jgi:hypothetical protein
VFVASSGSSSSSPRSCATASSGPAEQFAPALPRAGRALPAGRGLLTSLPGDAHRRGRRPGIVVASVPVYAVWMRLRGIERVGAIGAARPNACTPPAAGLVFLPPAPSCLILRARIDHAHDIFPRLPTGKPRTGPGTTKTRRAPGPISRRARVPRHLLRQRRLGRP